MKINLSNIVQQKKDEVDKQLKFLGNIVHHSVPVSNDEKDNRIERKFGNPKEIQNCFSHNVLLSAIDGYD